MTTNTCVTERAGAVRQVQMDNVTHRDRRFECGPVIVTDLVSVAIALDEAAEESIAARGGSGLGASAFLEALLVPDGVALDDYEPDDDDDCLHVDSWEDSVFSHLPVGPLKRLCQFICNQARSSVWDGHNYVSAPSMESESLLEFAP